MSSVVPSGALTVDLGVRDRLGRVVLHADREGVGVAGLHPAHGGDERVLEHGLVGDLGHRGRAGGRAVGRGPVALVAERAAVLGGRADELDRDRLAVAGRSVGLQAGGQRAGEHGVDGAVVGGGDRVGGRARVAVGVDHAQAEGRGRAGALRVGEDGALLEDVAGHRDVLTGPVAAGLLLGREVGAQHVEEERAVAGRRLPVDDHADGDGAGGPALLRRDVELPHLAAVVRGVAAAELLAGGVP